MKKRMKMALTILLIFCMLPMQAIAAEQKDDPLIEIMDDEEAAFYLDQYFPDDEISLYSTFSDTELGIVESGSKIMVICSTSVSEIASEIGTKSILLEEKNGLTWKAVGKVDKLSKENARTHTGGFYYTAPVRGKEYRVTGIHYAIINGKEYTKLASVDGFVY